VDHRDHRPVVERHRAAGGRLPPQQAGEHVVADQAQGIGVPNVHDLEPGPGERGRHGALGVAADMPGRDINRAHRERERRADQGDVPARPDQAGHAAQGPDIVLDVLEHVVGDQAGMLGRGRGRQPDLAYVHVRVFGQFPLQPDHHGLVCVGGGEPADQRDPLPRVVAQPAADLDRVIAQVGLGEPREPPAVVTAFRQRHQNVALNLPVAADFLHVRLSCSFAGGRSATCPA
jgi:hypothetical protein